MTPAISVRNVTKRFRIPIDRSTTLKYRVTHPISTSRYHELLAVDDISFDVPPGQFLGIIGSNGSGKSTLLKILAGIYRATSGSVVLDGPVSPFLELGVGFNPELTARENVLVNGAILGLSRGELKRRMEGILHFADLEDRADQKLKNFSSGMQVRLAFTVAIQADASILLMDEVLAVGDARFQAKCFEVFARYKREGKTVVLVTHDLGGVEQHCDRAILIDRGRIVTEGAAADVTAVHRRRSGEEAGEDAAAAEADEDDVDAAAAQNRWGTGTVRFRHVALEGGADNRGAHFETGTPMRLRLELEAREAVDDVFVGLQIHRTDGTLVTGTNTQMERVRVPALRAGERFSLCYSVERLLLLDGVYQMTVAATSGATSAHYDWFQNALQFSVSDVVGRIGLVHLGGRWEPGEEPGRAVKAVGAA